MLSFFSPAFGEIGSSESMATLQGLKWLEQHPAFSDLVTQLCSSEDRPESHFDGMPFVGEGDNSIVWENDGLAIKLSAPHTGREAWRKSRPIKPEDLLGQFRFLASLGEH